MDLTEQDFLTYNICPRKYQISKSEFYTEADKRTRDYVQMALNNFFTTIKHKPPSFKIMEDKWDSVVRNNEDYFMQFGSREIVNGKNHLIHIYSFFRENNIKFLDTYTPYRIDVDGSGIGLKGVLNPIIDLGKLGIEILAFDFGSKVPKKEELELKTKLSLDAYVANKIFNRPVSVRVHSLKTNYDGRTDIRLIKNRRDFERFENRLKDIGTMMNMGIMSPCESLECVRCHVKYLCKQ